VNASPSLSDDQVDGPGQAGSPEQGRVLVRFWASARAAAGVGEEYVVAPAPISLSELVERLVRDRHELRRVLGVCSVLVGDRPAGTADRSGVQVGPGDVVEFLPPFAGG
jgi:molybdopterin converting factor small subunit